LNALPPPVSLAPSGPPLQLKAHKPAEGWYGTRTSSITRFLEASRGSQRDFSDTKARAMKHDGQNLLFLLLWRFEEDGKPAQFKYWCVRERCYDMLGCVRGSF
jgi:hypothetical protein